MPPTGLQAPITTANLRGQHDPPRTTSEGCKVSNWREEFRMITETEEHGSQFSSRTRAQLAARVETQRTGICHTHYLTTTCRNLVDRICWTVIPISVARKRLTGGL